MPILFWDTETTGKIVDEKNPLTEGNPDLVQLAAILTDDNLNEVSALNCLIFPSKWQISAEVTAFHGISHQKAETYGLSLPTAVAVFDEMLDAADRTVAHNNKFDLLVMRRAYAQARREGDPFEGKENRCTMMAASPVLKLYKSNGTPRDPYRWPKLEKCIDYFFGEKLEGAHDALNDVRACIRVYRKLCEVHGIAP